MWAKIALVLEAIKAIGSFFKTLKSLYTAKVEREIEAVSNEKIEKRRKILEAMKSARNNDDELKKLRMELSRIDHDTEL